MVDMKEVAHDSKNDGGAYELCEPEDEREEA